jgi:DNA polymerase-1
VWADGRLRGSFNQRGTVTGRFSSNRPNLQNIPEIAREMIVAPEGKMLVGIDLSQQEVRYMAHLSGDKALQQPYLEGKDIYSTLASEVFNKPLEECGDGSKYRKMMKVGVLAVLYGISPFQLKDTLGITEEEAEKFLNDFKDKYPTMKQFMEETENEAFSNDFVWIEGGYKRRFPDGSKLKRAYETIQKKTGLKDLGKLWGSKLQYSDKRKYWDNVVKPYTSIQRQSTNSKIQGGSAVMTKLALIQLQEYFDTELTEDYKIIACVHDEVIFEIPENASEEVITKLAEIMAKALPMVIPMCCDIQYMKRWGVNIKESRRYDPNVGS